MTEQTNADRSMENRPKKDLHCSDECKKANRTGAKKFFKNKTLFITHKTAQYLDYSGMLTSELKGFARQLLVASNRFA